jgi:hypothetical protein
MRSGFYFFSTKIIKIMVKILKFIPENILVDFGIFEFKNVYRFFVLYTLRKLIYWVKIKIPAKIFVL